MLSQPRARRMIAGVTLLAVVIALPTHRARAQASTTVLLDGSFPGCNSPDPSAPAGSPTSQAWIVSVDAGGCSARGSAFSYLGVIGASAKARAFADFGLQSLFLRSFVASGWSEPVRPGMSARYLRDLDVEKLKLSFVFGATGSVAAAASLYSGAAAYIGYGFNFGGVVGTGDMYYETTLDPVTVGDWGTVVRTVDISRVVLPDGSLGFRTFDMSMSSYARAIVSGGYLADASAEANFGSTLVWGGIQQVRAFDGLGNEVVLGDDAAFSVIGATTGNDYVYASVETVTATPEPSSAVFIGTGLVVFGACHRRRRASLVREPATDP